MGLPLNNFISRLNLIEEHGFNPEEKKALYQEIKTNRSLQDLFDQTLDNMEWVSDHQLLVMDAIQAIYPSGEGQNKIVELSHYYDEASEALKLIWNRFLPAAPFDLSGKLIDSIKRHEILRTISLVQKGALTLEVIEVLKSNFDSHELSLFYYTLSTIENRSFGFIYCILSDPEQLITLFEIGDSSLNKAIVEDYSKFFFETPLCRLLTENIDAARRLVVLCEKNVGLRELLFQSNRSENVVSLAIHSKNIEILKDILSLCDKKMLLDFFNPSGVSCPFITAIHLSDLETLQILLNFCKGDEDLRKMIFEPVLSKDRETFLLFCLYKNDLNYLKAILNMCNTREEKEILIGNLKNKNFKPLPIVIALGEDVDLLFDTHEEIYEFLRQGLKEDSFRKSLIDNPQASQLLIEKMGGFDSLSEEQKQQLLRILSPNQIIQTMKQEEIEKVYCEDFQLLIPFYDIEQLLQFLKDVRIEHHYHYIKFTTTQQKETLLKNYPSVSLQTLIDLNVEEWSQNLKDIQNKKLNIFKILEDEAKDLWEIYDAESVDFKPIENLQLAFLLHEEESFKSNIEGIFTKIHQNILETVKIRSDLLMAQVDAENEAPSEFKDIISQGLMKDPYEVPTSSINESAKKWIDEKTLNELAEVSEFDPITRKEIIGLRNPATSRITPRDQFKRDLKLKRKIEEWKENWGHDEGSSKSQRT